MKRQAQKTLDGDNVEEEQTKTVKIWRLNEERIDEEKLQLENNGRRIDGEKL